MQRMIAFLFAALCPITALAITLDGKSVKVLVDEYGHYQVISEQSFTAEESIPLTQREYPRFIAEHQPVSAAKIIELRTTDREALNNWLQEHSTAPQPSYFSDEPEEVRTIVESGIVKNRINLVFMGDGYTLAEREKFFADIKRLTDQMFVGRTFASYLPLFNVYAVYKPSNKSGIGRGSPIDTAYGLYREGQTLRAIFPTKTGALHHSCSKAPGCDFPVVIANDPYYGGLGGEFAISTSSERSGMVVLRHELGHNFGSVGEEYDGGGYFGNNFSYSVQRITWKKWATESKIRPEPMVARFLDWPWQNLERGPFTASFESDGKYAKSWIRLSASGIETDDTLSIKFDDQPVPFKSPNRSDRSFINIPGTGFQPGSHKLVFSENIHDHNNWLSNLTVHEYAADFHSDPSFVGAFPVFADNQRVAGYRPTNESCLMRDMEHEFFCPVCQENNWLRFFAKIKIIDAATAQIENGMVKAELKTVGLGKFRTNGTKPSGEILEVRWYRSGQEMPELRDQLSWTKSSREIGWSVEVAVKFVSPEIREHVITEKRTITL